MMAVIFSQKQKSSYLISSDRHCWNATGQQPLLPDSGTKHCLSLLGKCFLQKTG